jgi:hypothetical protein
VPWPYKKAAIAPIRRALRVAWSGEPTLAERRPIVSTMIAFVACRVGSGDRSAAAACAAGCRSSTSPAANCSTPSLTGSEACSVGYHRGRCRARHPPPVPSAGNRASSPRSSGAFVTIARLESSSASSVGHRLPEQLLAGVAARRLPTDSPLPNLSIPGLLALGGADSDASVNLSALPGTKHGAVFTDAAHWDFLPGGRSPCQGGIYVGPYDLTWAPAADIVALFFGKYRRLESWPNPLEAIPDSLNPPRRRRSFPQMFYAIGHLASFSRLGSEPDCGVSLAWRTPNGNGSLTRP